MEPQNPYRAPVVDPLPPSDVLVFSWQRMAWAFAGWLVPLIGIFSLSGLTRLGLFGVSGSPAGRWVGITVITLAVVFLCYNLVVLALVLGGFFRVDPRRRR